MSIEQWNQRYRAGEQLFNEPSPLVTRFSRELKPGPALDLACGPGRNSLYLAEQGWRVRAVDGSPLAIEILRERARARKLPIDSAVSDLERGEFEIEPSLYGLICDCYYLSAQPDSEDEVRPSPGRHHRRRMCTWRMRISRKERPRAPGPESCVRFSKIVKSCMRTRENLEKLATGDR